MVSARARLLCACFSCFFSRFLVWWRCRSVVARWPPRPFRGLWGVSWLLLLSVAFPLSLLPVPRLRRCLWSGPPVAVSRCGPPPALGFRSVVRSGPSPVVLRLCASLAPPLPVLFPLRGRGASPCRAAFRFPSVLCAPSPLPPVAPRPGWCPSPCRPLRLPRRAALSARASPLCCPALACGPSRACGRLFGWPPVARGLSAPGGWCCRCRCRCRSRCCGRLRRWC